VEVVNEEARRSFHPIHAILLTGALPLFLGALLADVAYFSTSEMQWKNFASWLIVGGLVFGGFALIWAIAASFRAGRRRRPWLYPILLLSTWLLGFLNALIHAQDAWASMPEGLILSAVIVVLAMVVTGMGISTAQRGG
jgi:uncharacterized membrane protein